ncbi:MAG: UPF0182 family protein [Eubacteriales bacterium]|nr:UPF0182 family protein [Eubacteriales bacterium]
MENGEVKEKKKGSFFGKTFKIITLIVVILAVGCVILNEFYIDILWFGEVGYTDVFFKSLFTHLKLGIPLFVALFALFAIYFKLFTMAGGKTLPGGEPKGVFIKKKLPFLLAFVLAALSSVGLTENLWYKMLEFTNSVEFGEVDPVFGMDISFYMFRLPFLRSLLLAIFIIVSIMLMVTVVYSFLVVAQKSSQDRRVIADESNSYSKDDAKGFFSRMWGAFRVEITVFISIAFILGAGYFWLERYEILYSPTGIVYGASYTDVHVSLIANTIMAALCALSAVINIIGGLMGKIKPLILTCILMVGVYLLSGVAATAVQNFIVSPNEFAKESEYLEYSIASTQKAYALDRIETRTYTVTNDIDADDIAENATTIENIPINDYLPTLDTYNSLQSMRTYYAFQDVDVDRYVLNGNYTQLFISAREMDSSRLNADAQNWINTYLKYTHGFGVAMSPVNSINETGQPVLIAKDIPTVTDYPEITLTQPRIYFGEKTDNYAIVKTKAGEFDYPSGSDNVENVYDGTAGIPMSLLNRICFAVNEGTMKFLLSADINSDSVILINRNIMDRIMKIAPFLAYDSDPYMVVSEGRLYWIVDAMTTSDRYPYAQPSSSGYFNYIRNSVKVVIDAYNGNVDFYIVDDDPIAAVYANIYPTLFKSLDKMPDGIRAHLRYSEAMFKVQAEMYATYHMSNPSVFYNKEDAWAIATQYYNTNKAEEVVNPAYLIMKLPGREEEFLLMVPYTAANKNNMVAWMAGVCDGDEYGKLIVYEFNKQSLVYGPMQIEQRIDQDTLIAPQLALLAQQGSAVLRGNLLTIPIEDSILYIEPVYVKASQSATSLPEMKMVILSYKDQICMAPTLKEALEIIFGKPKEEEPAVVPEGSIDGKQDEGDGTGKPDTSADVSEFEALVIKAQQAYENAIKAQQSGDWAKYGEYMKELEEILNQLRESSAAPSSEQTPATEPATENDQTAAPDEQNPDGEGSPTEQETTNQN